jgi:hypothetical protein
MVIAFPAHKGDQEGRDSLPNHVYANAADPSISSILSFSPGIFFSQGEGGDQVCRRAACGLHKLFCPIIFSNIFVKSATCSDYEKY